MSLVRKSCIIALSAWQEEGKILRQERWEYPPKAIREAIANAICHRDYETTNIHGSGKDI
jgi:ATP-dependent DNA helicase RecG